MPDPVYYRDVFAARTRHEIASETHVIVGDHQPERRVNHEPCDANDGTTVAQCRGVACRLHNRCCWQ